MFSAVQHMSGSSIACGVILAIVFGFAVGNYACSLVYRLPRGRLILESKPYCGSCGAALQVRDLFPVVSALLLGHRCRYCHAPFPKSHTWTELLVGLLFVLAFFEYNFSEQFVLICMAGVFLITLAAIEVNERLIMGRIILCIIVSGMLLRTLQDGSIFEFVLGGLYGLIIGALLWRRQIKPVGHVYSLPKPLELLVVGGICVGAKGLLLFLAAYVVFYAVARLFSKVPATTIPFGFAVMMVLMYGRVIL